MVIDMVNLDTTDNEIGFTKECPTLTAKRQAAIQALGKRWILAEKIERKTPLNKSENK